MTPKLIFPPSASTVDRSADRESSGKRALDWVTSHLDLFDFRRESGASDQVQLMKPFSELMLVVSNLECNSLERSKIVDACWANWQDSRQFLRLLVARPDALELAGACASFARCGKTDQEVVGVLAAMLANRREWAGHLPPWRRLAIVHALAVLGVKGFPEGIPEGSVLFEMSPAWIVSTEIAYALTHEIFYLTDFGRRLGVLPPNVVAYVDFVLPVWMNIFLREENLDVVFELIICAQCLDLPVPEYVLSAAISGQEPDGAFSGPSGAGGALPQANDRERRFASRYHTTLVSLLALSEDAAES